MYCSPIGSPGPPRRSARHMGGVTDDGVARAPPPPRRLGLGRAAAPPREASRAVRSVRPWPVGVTVRHGRGPYRKPSPPQCRPPPGARAPGRAPALPRPPRRAHRRPPAPSSPPAATARSKPPRLVPAPGAEVHIRAFATRYEPHSAPGRPAALWLRTSPELAIKKLLAGGAGPVFELARVWRNGRAVRPPRPRIHHAGMVPPRPVLRRPDG